MSNYICTMKGLLGGSLPWSITMYFTGFSSDSAVSGTWNAACTSFWNATSPIGVADLYNAEVTAIGTTVATGNSTWHFTTATDAVLTGCVGTDTHDSLPWRNAVVVRFKSAQRNRSGRGRIFLPSPANDTFVGGVMTTSARNQIEVAADTYLRTQMVSSGLTQVVFNKKPLKDGTPAYTVKNITALQVPGLFYTQRRRDHKLVPVISSGP